MGERDYSHRDVVDKLGVKPGYAVAFEEAGGKLDPELIERVQARAGREGAGEGETVDVVLIAGDAWTDVGVLLTRWRNRLTSNGGIWVLTPKRGLPGYVDQRVVMDQGLATAMVDNKTCSVSETTSAIRFVIRRRDRA